MRRKELGKYCYMILISNLNVVVLRVECQRLDITGREVQQQSWQTVRASRCSPCWCGTCRCQPCRSLSSKAQEDIVEQELDNDDDGGGDGGGDGESKGKSGDLFDQIFNLRIGGPILGLHVGGDKKSHLLINNLSAIQINLIWISSDSTSSSKWFLLCSEGSRRPEVLP